MSWKSGSRPVGAAFVASLRPKKVRMRGPGHGGVVVCIAYPTLCFDFIPFRTPWMIPGYCFLVEVLRQSPLGGSRSIEVFLARRFAKEECS